MEASLFLQPFYDHLITNYGNILASQTFRVVYPIGFYFVLISIFTFFDITKLFSGNRLHPEFKIESKHLWNTFKSTMKNNLFFVLPLSMFAIVFLPPITLPKVAPTISELLIHLFISFVLFDFIYFVWHWLHHKSETLYKFGHEFHHQYRKPFALVTQHLHWSELLATTLMSVGIPEIIGLHVLTYWIWIPLSIYISVDAHIGYEFSLSLSNWIPFYGGAVTHDYHHLHPKTNYEPFFTYLDRLFGTNYDPKQKKKIE
eukprot:gene2455-3165_t